MRQDLLFQVSALKKLAQEAATLKSKGDSMIPKLINQILILKQNVTKAKIELKTAVIDMEGREKLLKEQEVKMVELQNELAVNTKSLKEIEETLKQKKTKCIGRKKRWDWNPINAIENTFNKAVNEVQKVANTAANEVKETFKSGGRIESFACQELIEKDNIQKYKNQKKHTEAKIADQTREMNITKGKVLQMQEKISKIKLDMERTTSMKSVAEKSVKEMRQKLASINHIQTKLKEKQMKISDLLMKLETMAVNVQLDALRDGIDAVVDLVKDLSQDVIENAQFKEEKEVLKHDLEALTKKKG